MTTLEERFFAKVHPEPNTGCWLWAGSVNKDGYGRIRTGSKKTTGATHVSLQIVGVTIPPGMCACHKCDVPQCVNPDHLFIGTYKDNMQDAKRKGRMVFTNAPRKDVCPRGHEKTGDNLYLLRGKRDCKACVKIRDDARKQRFVAAGLTCHGNIRKGRAA